MEHYEIERRKETQLAQQKIFDKLQELSDKVSRVYGMGAIGSLVLVIALMWVGYISREAITSGNVNDTQARDLMRVERIADREQLIIREVEREAHDLANAVTALQAQVNSLQIRLEAERIIEPQPTLPRGTTGFMVPPD